MPSYDSGLRFERIVVPTPYAVGPANVYVTTAEPITLVDCGPNTPAAENALRLGLAAHGLSPEQIARVVISHGHPDHYGLAPRLREISGAQILIGELDAAKLAQEEGMLQAMGRLLLRAGVPVDTLRDMGRQERTMGRDLHPRVEDVVRLRGGELLGFDGFELEMLHLPGHTAGHICPWDPSSGALFSGDTLLLEISPNPLMEPHPKDPTERRKSLVEYIGTLDVLAGMPLSTVFPGHGPVIEDPNAVIEEMRRHHRKRVERIAGLLTGGEKTAWELATDLFPNLRGFDNYLAISEVVAHVDLLVLDGRVEEIDRDGVTVFRGVA